MLIALVLTVVFAVAADAKMLIPGGHTIGMKAYADGLVVTAVEEGSPAADAGIKQGDILREMEGAPLKSAGELIDRMTDGREIHLEFDRGKETRTVSVQPERRDSQYRLGAFVRDNVAGIGTVSYYDPEDGSFGALGHGISEPGGETLLPICGGVTVKSRVGGVVKGKSGTAGQLQGEFDAGSILGDICKNTEQGVFGTQRAPKEEALPVAEPEQVQTGAAVIRSNVYGDAVEEYSIEILKCYGENSGKGRNMLIEVTDAKLLELTGGIVQGMSGSPIIQDGKLVGAVTHVLVNDPTRGYGIFIENMLDAAG